MIDAFVGEVSDYGKMLKKLSHWAFLNVTIITAVVAAYVPWVKSFTLFFSAQLFGFPLLGALPGVCAAILSQHVPLHDWISDRLKIRLRFDVTHILMPLAAGVGIPVSAEFEKLISANRKKLVDQVFYPHCYNQHLITMALTSWSWYWVFLEATVYLAIAGVITAVDREFSLAAVFLVAIGLAALAMWVAYVRSRRYAAREVEEILAAPERHPDIRSSFNALQGPR